jgi:hypothetical protein
MQKRPKPKPLLTATAFVKANPDLPELFIKTVKIWGRLYPSVRFSPARDGKDGKTWFTIAGLPDEVIDNLMNSGKPMPAKRKVAKKQAAKSVKKARPVKQAKKAKRPTRRK